MGCISQAFKPYDKDVEERGQDLLLETCPALELRSGQTGIAEPAGITLGPRHIALNDVGCFSIGR